MAAETINVTPYNGGLLELQLLSASQTIVLGDFGTPTLGDLTDTDGLLSDADDGTATFDGAPLNYIGSGTATPGIDIAGITVPLGAPVDLVVFEAAGQIYFHFPDGPPNLLSAVAVVTDLSPAPYTVFTPLCFGEGTMIDTPAGDVPIETLHSGDLVRDVDGKAHEILWHRRCALEIPDILWFDKWLPVRIRAGAFGPGRPYRDTFLSQQHRVLLEGDGVSMAAGVPAGFARAAHLVNGSTVRIARGQRKPVYHHILCREHVVLRANGMPAESLLLRSDSLDTAAPESTAEAMRRFPELVDHMQCAYPVMTRHEAQAVSHQFAAEALRLERATA